jgi:hypothetical protein
MMATNMVIKAVVVEHIPGSCQCCEFGYDNGWLDSPPKDTCILMNEPLDDILNCVIRPDWCPLVTEPEYAMQKVNEIFDGEDADKLMSEFDKTRGQVFEKYYGRLGSGNKE